METKELLTVEFRYNSLNKYKDDYNSNSNTITVGIYDTVEEAIKEGNKVLNNISHYFDDNKFTKNKVERFSLNGIFGNPKRLVSDLGVRHTTGVQMFAKIETLKFDSVEDSLIQAIKNVSEYKKWRN